MSKSYLKSLVFIGAAVVLAGGVFVFTRHQPVQSIRTQGAIGQREVYRDPQQAGDVRIQPGAPVVAKTLMETKEFKSLASDPRYSSLVTSQAFNAMLANPQAVQAAASPNFQAFVRSYAASLNAQISSNANAQNNAAFMPRFMANSTFRELANSPAFAALVRSSGFVAMVQSSNFQQLAQSSYMQSLQQTSAFNAMLANSGAAQQ